MKDHKDKTADKAIGHVNREWKQMCRLALLIRNGHGHPAWVEEKTKLFTGIYKRLLTDPIDEIQREIR